MTITYSSVGCAEVHASVVESFDIETGGSAKAVVQCDWSNRLALIADVLGNRRPFPYSAASKPPKAYSASSVPMPGEYANDGQGASYDQAFVTINYSTKIQDLLSESLEPTAEFITQDYQRFRWAAADGDPLLEAEAPGKLFKGMNIVRTRYQLAAIPVAVGTEIGKVNTATYTSALLGLSFAAETLLYQPPNISRVIRTDGSDGFTLTLKFTYKPQGWNKFWRAKTQSWEKIFLVDPAGEYKSYELGNFATLVA